MKTTINIATFRANPEGPNQGWVRKETLLKTLKSLQGQADEIRVYFNGVISKPNWMPTDVKVICGAHNDLTDIGKFYFLKPDAKEYYFTCDDDIAYPKTYVQDMIQAIETHGCIVTHHGRKLVPNAADYYRSHPAMRCIGAEPMNKPLDVPGTGVTAFDTRYFNPFWLKHSTIRKASDLAFALEAAKEGKEIIGLAHEMNYLRYLYPPVETTIHETERKNQRRLIELADQIYQTKYGN